MIKKLIMLFLVLTASMMVKAGPAGTGPTGGENPRLTEKGCEGGEVPCPEITDGNITDIVNKNQQIIDAQGQLVKPVNTDGKGAHH